MQFQKDLHTDNIVRMTPFHTDAQKKYKYCIYARPVVVTL